MNCRMDATRGVTKGFRCTTKSIWRSTMGTLHAVVILPLQLSTIAQRRRIKLRYAHLGGSNPPIIVVHGNQVDAVPRSYTRYLENTFRKVLKLTGTPIRVEYKGSDNPYADRKNTLTERQVNKKRRLMSHNKKMKKKSKDKR